MNPRRHIVAAGTRDVPPRHVRDAQPRRVASIVGVDARGHVDGLVNLGDLEVLKCDVLDVPAAGVRLDPCRIG